MRFIGKWMAMLWLASAAYGQDVALFTEVASSRKPPE